MTKTLPISVLHAFFHLPDCIICCALPTAQATSTMDRQAAHQLCCLACGCLNHAALFLPPKLAKLACNAGLMTLLTNHVLPIPGQPDKSMF